MTDPHTSMSLAAILVLTVVVMVLVVGWLVAVFRAGHRPAPAVPGRVAKIPPAPRSRTPSRPAVACPPGRVRQPGGPHRSPVTTRRASRCRLAPGSPGERRAGFRQGLPGWLASIINC